MGLFGIATPLCPAQASSLPTLTAAAQVHSLTYEQSLHEYPVRLRREQVLYYNPTLGNLFVRDSSHGVYIDVRGIPPLDLKSGDLLDIEGVTGPGGYAPVVEKARITKVGSAPLPPAPPYSLDHLLTGVEDSQWVEAEGVVRAVEVATEITRYANQAASGGTTLQVSVATGAGRLDVIVRERGGLDYHNLIDAKVRVEGVMGPRFNQERQLTGIHMFAENMSQFHVIERGTKDPFSLPLRELNTVMRFTPDAAPGHRIRVRGVVTAIRQGTLLSIANGDHGLFIRTAQANAVHVGDLIDVAGFPALGDYTPVLEDVTYRKLGAGEQPAPIEVTSDQLFSGEVDARVVNIRAELLKQTRTLHENTLLLAADDKTFSAVIPEQTSSKAIQTLVEGSLLELTGTCYVEVNANKTPKGVQLLLRSPADVSILRRPSWWTTQHTAISLGLSATIILIALAWIALLRRRVLAQSIALEKAREEARVITDLARAMQEVAAERNFATRVASTGSDRIAQLGVTFNRMLSELESRDIAKKQAETKLHELALTDELTRLPNRRLLSDRLSHSLAIAERENKLVALLYIDLDGFKLVNDSLGHTVGDLLLVQVAGRLQSRIRQADTLARLGGDEFTVLLNSLRSQEEAELVGRSLLESLVRPFVVEGHEIVIAASIGISVYPEHGADAVTLLQHADSAMYAAKKNGKNQVKSFTPEIGSTVRERMTLENQLRGAIARGEIHLHYQPEFDVATGRLIRFEALARWTHPVFGEIPPSKFIPIAEESGQIITLGAYLMEEACVRASRWEAIAGYPVQVAVNVSSLQFSRPSFVEEVMETLQYAKLRPSLLQIELTESIMLSGTHRTAETMQQLRTFGINLAIDDFGTGYSCLSYLPRLPFNTLKIDRSFVRELEMHSGAEAIVRSLTTLAHSLGMRIIVEGIEKPAQLEMLRLMGADDVQGHLLGKPNSNPEEQLSNSAFAVEQIQAAGRATAQTASN